MPPLPEAFYWIELTRAVNGYLGSNYKVDDLKLLPSDELDLLEMRIAVQQGPLDYDDSEETED